MAISYNTGVTASADNATTCAPVIPAGVLTGDVMIMSLALFTEDSSAPSISFSGAGGTWTKVTLTGAGANPELSSGSSIFSYGFAYTRVASAGDPGATLTVTETGSSGSTTWWAIAIASYTGANTSTPVDVAAGGSITGQAANSITSPSLTTGAGGDWGLQLFGGGDGGGGTQTFPATNRQKINSDQGVMAGISDTNGSAGGSGSSIGGGTFSQTNSASSCWMTSFTIGLAAAAGGAGVAVAAPHMPVIRTETVRGRGSHRIIRR